MILPFWRFTVFFILGAFLSLGLYVDMSLSLPHRHLTQTCQTCSGAFHRYDASANFAAAKLQTLVKYLSSVKTFSGLS